MSPTDAIVMENFYPTASTVNLRYGRSKFATGVTGSIKTLIPFNPGVSNKLFAATQYGIHDVTFGGSIGSPVTTCTNGRWEFRNFRNSAGSWLVMVNGVDKMKIYNGTTWTDLDADSSPAITGISTTEFTNVNLFKRRLWFTGKNSLSAYYLPIDAIGGAAVEFPMGPIFDKGGYLVAQYNWTIDGGQGSDDYLVTVTSQGQLAVYQGTDPASASTFSLVGVYYVGKPIGKRCFIKYGGDVLYLSKNGVFVLSKLMLSAILDRTNSLSDKIDEAFKNASSLLADNFGWQAILHPTQNALIVNVPVVEGGTSMQFVMNNITKAWCKFTNWNSDCFAEFDGQIYSAQGSNIYLLWTGSSDDGAAIPGKCQQAYFSAGRPCQVNLVRPNISAQGSLVIQTAIDTDFSLFSGISEESYISLTTGISFWDQGQWDIATWSAGIVPIGQNWFSCPNNPGIFHSFRLQCTSSTATLTWTSTDFGIVPTGLL